MTNDYGSLVGLRLKCQKHIVHSHNSVGLQFFILIRYYMCPMIVVWRNVNQVSSRIIFLIFLRMDCRSELSVSFDHFCQSIGNLILVEQMRSRPLIESFEKSNRPSFLYFFIFLGLEEEN
jgi:hypothetical protein